MRIAVVASIAFLAIAPRVLAEPVLAHRDVSLSPAPPAQERSLDSKAPSLRPASLLLRRHGDDEHEHIAEHSEMDSSHEMNHAHAAGGGHVHKMSHDPWKTINETDVLLHHSPDPLSYWEYDGGEEGRGGILVAHIVFMTLAFFLLLPTALYLKAASSPLAVIPQAAFLGAALFGHLLGMIYNKATPNLYPSSSHTRFGWIIMLIVLALNAYEVAVFAVKLKKMFFKGEKYSEVMVDSDSETTTREVKDEEAAPLVHSPIAMDDSAVDDSSEINWQEAAARSDRNGNGRTSSTLSDDTLFDPAAHDIHHPAPSSLRNRLSSVAHVAHVVVQRSVVLMGYAQVLSGVAIWTGTCRAEYLNGCMAHSIKGSIFVWYGLLTFARYVGAYAEYGWAWNRRPKASSSAWSAEFTESFVIFLYGSTNTWMERFGAAPGSPYSIKDVQHISIAVMFWFAGGLGMLLESQIVRSWLSQTSIIASGRPTREVAEPSSASFSFNPFPALCIGVTGIAMAAHAQAYQFQVDVHALWGQLLAGFAIFRFLTYFFLFLRPPASILPSRPPTEALASFCLTAGGVVFILSIEQVTFAAMRHQFDDVMAFMNVTVALVCIVFTWILALFAMKGWALLRQQPAEGKAHHSHHRSVSMAASERFSREAKPRRLANFA